MSSEMPFTVSAATGNAIRVPLCPDDDDETLESTKTSDQSPDRCIEIPLKEEADPENASMTSPTDIESHEDPKPPKRKKSVEFRSKAEICLSDESSDDSSIGRFHTSTTHSEYFIGGGGSLTQTSRSHLTKEEEEVAMEQAMQQTGYKDRKRMLVVLTAALLAFNNGFLNGACLSGLVSPGSTFPALTVTGLTASYTLSGLGLSDGDFLSFGIHSGIIISYFTGTFIAGLITPDAKPFRLEPTYGPTFMLGGVLLLIGGIVAIFEEGGIITFFLSAAASGMQNGIASKYSANLIRCTVTGTTTDIALVLAEIIRGNRKNLENGKILAIITCNFWLGGLVSFFAATKFRKYTLLANAIMFWVIGIGLILFLVTELGLSVNAAMTGNWKWRKHMQNLRASHLHGDVSLIDMFDIIDADGDGQVTPTELLKAFVAAGVTTDLRTVKVLVNYADTNHDGYIDREEWNTIVAHVLNDDLEGMKDLAIQGSIDNLSD